MKNLVLILLLLPAWVMAQHDGPRRPNVIDMATVPAKSHQELSVMKDSLGLNEADTAKVQAILINFLREVGLLSNLKLSVEERGRQLRLLEKKRDEELEAVLTKQQYKQYKEMQKAHQERMKARVRS